VNGEPVQSPDNGISLKTGSNPVLVRYDSAGRGHFVVRQHDISGPSEKNILSMRWAGDKGIIPFDINAGQTAAEWFRFLTAPGTSAITVRTPGDAEAWIDGVPMKKQANGRFVAEKAPQRSAVVAIRITPPGPGISGGALIPEPVTVETDDSGLMKTGDWSEMGILNNYSGGIRYKTKINLTSSQAKSGVIADLGRVAGTAGIIVNGKEAGVRVAPPWKTDITDYVKRGENIIEILVYNTLSNHYQTIPSRYKGNPASGLFGPVKLLISSEKPDKK